MADKIIVLVEDNPNDELLTLRALRHNKIANEIVVARDGADALDLLLRRGARSDAIDGKMVAVVLLDIKLPKVDGLEVLRELRGNASTRRLPVVILTSSKEQQDLIRGYDLGANSYIQKPVDFTNFSDALRQLGLYWIVLNEPPPDGRYGA